MIEMNYRVLIVEDDVDMAKLNSRLLRRNGYDVDIASNMLDALSMAKDVQYDLYILDIGLPDGSGLDLCLELKEYSDTQVLFLTGKSETKDKVEGLYAGCDYYLTKPFDKLELLAAVHNLILRAERTREKIGEVNIFNKGPLTINLSEHKAYVEGVDAELTPKEFALLYILVQNEDVTVTSDRLYESVWNAPMYNNSGTIRVHIFNLKKKINEENTDEYSINYVKGQGYIFTSS